MNLSSLRPVSTARPRGTPTQLFYVLAMALLLACLALLGQPALAAPITVTDILGRKVTLPRPATRVVLGQGRHFQVLSLLTPNPAAVLVGWSDEYKTSFAPDYKLALEKYPALARVPIVGHHTPDTFSVERTLALKPDLVILSAAFAGIRRGQPDSASPILSKLDAAQVPVVVIDFFLQPLENTIPSLRVLGQVLGHEGRATRFIAFYQQQMARVAAKLKGLPDNQRPRVFLHALAGMTDCCYSPGVGVFNDMIQYAGGHNIGADVLKGPTGALNLEYINSVAPQVYVATGTGGNSRGGLVVGAGASLADARASLRRIITEDHLEALPAIRSGNAHGVWHAFNDSPLNVVLVEALAHWIHPHRFADLDAQKTLDTINREFLDVPLKGTYLFDLN